MANINAMRQYEEQVINTATPGMVTVMLFEEIIKNINLGMKAIDEKNIQDSHNSILKAENIYLALHGYLDERFEISKPLSKMYEFLAARLVDANVKKDKEILKEVLTFTTEFRDTWRQAEKNARIEHMKSAAARINKVNK